MTCGPWKPIHLDLYDLRIADLHFRTELNSDLTIAEIVATADIEGSDKTVHFELSIDGNVITEETVRGYRGLASVTFKFQNPQLWWPFTHGSQPLYKLSASLLNMALSIIDNTSKTFGIREIELIQHPLQDQDGKSFFFQINNVPIFITGACWIPGDSFTPQITSERYRRWVSLARNCNQVMLRVWGGGIFERDAFCDACDELGILVWQDFMFACGNYPTHPKMLQTVKMEAEQNMKLLRHHPSIAIWAGNNEDYLYGIVAGLHYVEDDLDPQSWLKSDFLARYIMSIFFQPSATNFCPERHTILDRHLVVQLEWTQRLAIFISGKSGI
jgi:beta-mannosidase